MSGIYIPLDLPEEITPELVIDFTVGIDGKRYARFYNYRVGGMTDWHEILQVPDHGDLIDKKELFLATEYGRDHHTHTDGLAARHHKAEFNHFLNMIAYAPTIIPEDKEEDK